MSRMKEALEAAAERLVAAQGAARTDRADAIWDAVMDGTVVPVDELAYQWERDGLRYAAHDRALFPESAGRPTTLTGATP